MSRQKQHGFIERNEHLALARIKHADNAVANTKLRMKTNVIEIPFQKIFRREIWNLLFPQNTLLGNHDLRTRVVRLKRSSNSNWWLVVRFQATTQRRENNRLVEVKQ